VEDPKVAALEELDNRLYMKERYGLNYAKLYLDYDGGYDMERLKKVMLRMKKDEELGLEMLDDLEMAESRFEKLEKMIRQEIEEAKQAEGEGEGEGEEEEGEEDEAKQAADAYREKFMNVVEEDLEGDDEKALFKELMKFIKQNKEKEFLEDQRDGTLSEDEMDLMEIDDDLLSKMQEEENRLTGG
jgi:cysteinyl-tRNA synthetase